MFFLPFGRDRISGKIKNNFEIVSVHIPKTAGTSFRNILKGEYGNKAVVRLDIPLNIKEKVKINERLFLKDQLPKRVRVAHGHFSPELLSRHFELGKDIKYITWLRHPVERVISNYYYLQKILAGIIQEEKRGVDILRKMQRSLMEYAATEVNRNRMTRFLAGRNINEFDFVGIQEFYEADVNVLSNLLNWKPLEIFEHNITGDKPIVSDADRDTIAQLNRLDMEIYNQAIGMRANRDIL